ncbi:HEAT repeat protein [Laceyella sediminis]|uniref:HEAT repeat protein n=1 Tax=Laceyella sediminis TaxID=573074 RepID=A0ABX5ELU7_9BACL|nr:conserved virulence factor C family protein [Laceyella sediminis]PRZ13060.1 HEAT repeat protein [Laceyella sediminis]
MKIVSIEPTPSPNVMKCNVDETLPAGTSYNVTKDQMADAPHHLRRLLEIDGVKSLFQVLDFISIERHPKADWPDVLAQVREVLGDAAMATAPEKEESAADQESFGEVQVFIQKLKGIPMQVKCVRNGEEMRFGLPERFKAAVMRAQTATSNLVFEREWVEQRPRYGEMSEVGEQVVEELAAAYDEVRLSQMVERVLNPEQERKEQTLTADEVMQAFNDENWEKRYAALEQYEPNADELHVLDRALDDAKASIRRLAVVYLGFIGGKAVLPYVMRALRDASPIVRRTAGDTLSDIGDPEAIPAMCDALKDTNKLVRWRAARFLYEVGDESALPALRDAVNDPEFEVRLQARLALERIERGEEASGTVWQQMMKRMEEEKKK